MYIFLHFPSACFSLSPVSVVKGSDVCSDIVFLVWGQQERPDRLRVSEHAPVVPERGPGLAQPPRDEDAGPGGGPQLAHVHQPPLVHKAGGGHQEVQGDHRVRHLEHARAHYPLVRPLIQVIAAAIVWLVAEDITVWVERYLIFQMRLTIHFCSSRVFWRWCPGQCQWWWPRSRHWPWSRHIRASPAQISRILSRSVWKKQW